MIWVCAAAFFGFLAGYRIAGSINQEWPPIRKIRMSFPGIREDDDQHLKLLHDMLYTRIGFVPERVLSYVSLSIDQRAFRVEVFFGPRGQAATMHLLLEQGAAIPVRVVRFPYSVVVEDWDIPSWNYLVDYLARGDVPAFYCGVTEYLLDTGEREFIEEFSIGNMENSDRVAASPLLRTCQDRWLVEQERRRAEAAQAQAIAQNAETP